MGGLLCFDAFIQVACGALGWRPTDFWDSTFYEYSNAYVGYMKVNGIGCWSKEKGRRLTRREVKELKHQLAEEQKVRPDGKVTDPALKDALREIKRMRKENDIG